MLKKKSKTTLFKDSHYVETFQMKVELWTTICHCYERINVCSNFVKRPATKSDLSFEVPHFRTSILTKTLSRETIVKCDKVVCICNMGFTGLGGCQSLVLEFPGLMLFVHMTIVDRLSSNMLTPCCGDPMLSNILMV